MTDDMMSEFVAEATDHLTRAEEILLGFSRQPDQVDAEAINACFRSLHTIKGCSGFLDLQRIQHLSHAGEQILDALRTNDLRGSLAVFDALLQTVARLQAHIAHLSGQSGDLPDSDEDCVQMLEGVRHVTAVLTSATSADPGTLAAISAAISELIVAGPDDAAAVTEALTRLAQRMLVGTWHPEARPVMTRMRHLADGLSGTKAQDHFQQILTLCSQLESLQRTGPVAIGKATTGATTVSEGTSGALGEFVSEATELLNQAEATVLGGKSFSADQVNSVFRAFHTVKGMAAYLSLPEVEHGAHRFEAQIQQTRDSLSPADENFSATVLCGVDAMRELVAQVKRLLITGIHRTTPPSTVAAPTTTTCMTTTMPVVAEDPRASVAPVAAVAPAGERIGDLLADLGVPRQVIEQTAAELKPGERIGEKLVADGAATRQQVEKAVTAQQALKTSADVFSRVATAKLEELMNQVGELLIAQAMVQHNPELPPNSNLAQAVGRQGRILRNLQVLSLSLRMVPLRGTFQKMARVVYDTAKKLGKQVEFSLGGEDTEIDRTLAETMGDPLMHMVRNGIDHGIEMPDVRVKNGKPAVGKLRLEAFQAGDDVVIRLIDDGAGMDPQRLRAKAIEKGLIDSHQPMDEQACFQIIFLPGFSTAAKVTDVSGRGVGMD
ncbi:MAG TPA: Hpt domain-containing protein, partial [Planctomycetota bacterium]|nr:Hpt domain-containing protein [Planctomycetota bacterium]